MEENCKVEGAFLFEETGSANTFQIPEEASKPIYIANIQLLPGSDELHIENIDLWKRFMLSEQDYDRLKSLGLKGRLKVVGCTCLGDTPEKARALLVMQRQIREPIDLPQPDMCEVIYLQEGDSWRKFPAEAPVLRRRIRLNIDSEDENCTYVFTEAYYGSVAGGGGRTFCW